MILFLRKMSRLPWKSRCGPTGIAVPLFSRLRVKNNQRFFRLKETVNPKSTRLKE
jgi:hypothetical protein